jgi:hypothetical protein
MSTRRLTTCRILGSLGLAAVLATAAVVGANAITAAKRGDLFPQMHWSTR